MERQCAQGVLADTRKACPHVRNCITLRYLTSLSQVESVCSRGIIQDVYIVHDGQVCYGKNRVPMYARAIPEISIRLIDTFYRFKCI